MVDSNKKPETKDKAIAAPKQRYFVPELGREVEATDLAEVAQIVKKESKPAEDGKGEVTKG